MVDPDDTGASDPPVLTGKESHVFEGIGLFGLLVLIADVWAIINVVQSSETTGTKALWVALVLVLPLLGLIIWYFAGPKSASD